jgi:hypothetical protein
VRWNDSAIVVGCIPLFNIFSAAESNELHKTTTEVVPSPASTSWAADKSTSLFDGVSLKGAIFFFFFFLFFFFFFYHLCGRMKNSHVFKNGGTIIGDDNLSVSSLNLL